MLNKKRLKKFVIYLFTSLLISIFVISISILFPSLSESFDKTLRDSMFLIRGEIKNSNNIIIVDIDEKSLKDLGQWPWNRNKFAQVLENLTNANVGAIGLDIVFAEKDNSSPHKIFKEYNISVEGVPNYDEILAKTIASTPTILGYLFELGDNKFVENRVPYIPAIMIEKNKPKNEDYIINANGIILNLDILQENSYSSGFFNNIPDSTGMVRNVPLVIRYDGQMYPSLSLEILRISLGVSKIIVNYNSIGVENISVGDLIIPTDKYGRLVVNYRGAKNNFKYVSASDIYNNTFNKKEFEGKIILLGTSAAGLMDLRAIPFDSFFPGIEIHANAIDNMIVQDFLSKPLEIYTLDMLIIFILSFLAVMLVTYTPFWINPFVLIISGVLFSIFTYFILFDYGIILNIFLPLFAIFLGTVISTFLDYIFEVKKEQQIKKKFATKVSVDVMNALLLDMENNNFQAMQREVTITFSDVRGFTNISEAMPNAQTLIDFMNDYMTPMTKIIMNYKGTIDKYIGDAIMSYWNAPSSIDNHASLAVDASLEQLHALYNVNKKIRKNKKYENVIEMSNRNNVEIIDIGIGINTGKSTVGEMGSKIRSDYTVIGDPVNLASRLESLCKFYNSKLNISNFTKEQIDEKKYIFRFLDLVRVKGKKEPVEIWQIHDYSNKIKSMTLYECDKDELQNELNRYHNAIKLYKEQNFNEALNIFKSLDDLKIKTNKNIYKIYIKRCETYIQNPPMNFDGVFEHTTKG